MTLFKALRRWWKFKPTSGPLRQYFHFMPLSVPAVIVFICFLSYAQSSFSFIFDKNVISKVSVYDTFDSPWRPIAGLVMLMVILLGRWRPYEVALFVVILTCSLRIYDSIHLHSYAALDIYIPFLIFGVPPIFHAIRRD